MKIILLKSLSVLVGASGLLVGSVGCKTVDDVLNPKLPEATQEGKNTFGCLANNTLWLPYNLRANDFPYNDYELRTNRFFPNSAVLTIEVNNFSEKNGGVSSMRIAINSTSPIAPGVYTLSNGFSASASAAGATPGGFDTSTAGTGRVTITKVEPFDRTVNGFRSIGAIVSGTFEFTAGGYNGAAGQTMTVADGRFDLQPMQ